MVVVVVAVVRAVAGDECLRKKSLRGHGGSDNGAMGKRRDAAGFVPHTSTGFPPPWTLSNWLPQAKLVVVGSEAQRAVPPGTAPTAPDLLLGGWGWGCGSSWPRCTRGSGLAVRWHRVQRQ